MNGYVMFYLGNVYDKTIAKKPKKSHEYCIQWVGCCVIMHLSVKELTPKKLIKGNKILNFYRHVNI